ncbi:MAG: hypothetical protein ACREMD_12015, partial [Gemmatimonadota bacterium]
MTIPEADPEGAVNQRGKIAAYGGDRKSNFKVRPPDLEKTFKKGSVRPPDSKSFTDLGLDKRRVAEARLIRDTYTDADIERLRAEADAKDRERDENTCRLDMKPSEFVALGRKLEEMERSKAK